MHNQPTQLPEDLEDELQRKLRQSLRRLEAPAGFAEGVLRELEIAQHQRSDLGITSGGARARLPETSHRPRLFTMERQRSLTLLKLGSALAAAMVFLLLLPLGGHLYRRHQQAQAEAAAQQFALAMRLTQSALLDAGQQVAQHSHTREREQRP